MSLKLVATVEGELRIGDLETKHLDSVSLSYYAPLLVIGPPISPSSIFDLPAVPIS